MSGLPDGWREVRLDELATGGLFVDGDWVETKDQDHTGKVRLTQLADVGEAEFRDRSDRWMREDQAARLGCTRLEPGDLLIARMPQPLARCAQVPDTIGAAVTAVDVAVLRIRRDDVVPRYVMWAINSPAFRRSAERLQTGTTRKRISRRNLAGLTVPLAPLDEQHRIVAVLEDHLSRLDAAFTYVKTAASRVQLVRELISPDIPLVRLGDVVGDVRYGTSVKCSYDGAGWPVLRIPDVASGLRVQPENLKRAVDRDFELAPFRVEAGDVLMVRSNGSRDLVGRMAEVGDGLGDTAFASYLIRLRTDRRRLLPGWLVAATSLPAVRRQIESAAASSAGQHNLNKPSLQSLVLPLPPLDEQAAWLAAELELSAHRDRLKGAAQATHKQAATLRAAVLSAAHNGQLL